MHIRDHGGLSTRAPAAVMQSTCIIRLLQVHSLCAKTRLRQQIMACVRQHVPRSCLPGAVGMQTTGTYDSVSKAAQTARSGCFAQHVGPCRPRRQKQQRLRHVQRFWSIAATSARRAHAQVQAACQTSPDLRWRCCKQTVQGAGGHFRAEVGAAKRPVGAEAGTRRGVSLNPRPCGRSTHRSHLRGLRAVIMEIRMHYCTSHSGLLQQPRPRHAKRGTMLARWTRCRQGSHRRGRALQPSEPA